MLCPERTFSLMRSEVSSGSAGSAGGVGSGAFGSSGGRTSEMARPPVSGRPHFSQFRDQPGQARVLRRHGGEVDDDGAAGEEAGRALDLRVELAEPIGHRGFRGEDERHEGASPDPEGSL
jgi:hypothetical protein